MATAMKAHGIRLSFAGVFARGEAAFGGLVVGIGRAVTAPFAESLGRSGKGAVVTVLVGWPHFERSAANTLRLMRSAGSARREPMMGWSNAFSTSGETFEGRSKNP